MYFVTRNAYGRECLFGDLLEGRVRLRPAGEAVAQTWLGLLRSFPVTLDFWVVMPHNFHGIVILETPAIGRLRF